MYKHLYQRFLKANADQLHFAAHSHHFWPDITREAMLSYWDDSARFVDDKWGHFFSEMVPQLQKQIARELNLSRSENISFAPNTHELLYRLLSCFPADKKLKILTTDSEFYSFARQVKRLKEDNLVELDMIETDPFESFDQRFIQKAQEKSYDMIFLSHVFFNSGRALNSPIELITQLPKGPMVVVDGYHGFMALPFDFSKLQERIFYLSGSYKYAQGGEGACFLYSPNPEDYRPRYTGWFAEIGELAQQRSEEVPYSKGALRFAGSTIDLSALYRLKSVFDLFESEGISTSAVHRYVLELQEHFITKLNQHDSLLGLNINQIINAHNKERGHFLTFELKSTKATLDLVRELHQRGIKVDSRGNRLRFGFGMYIDKADVDELIQRMQS